MLRLARVLVPLAILALPAAAQSTPGQLRAQIDELAQASTTQGRDDSIRKLELLVFEVGEASLIAKHAFVALGDLHGAQGDWESAASYYRAAAVDLLARVKEDAGTGELERIFDEEFEEKQPRVAHKVVLAEPEPIVEEGGEYTEVAAAAKRIQAYEQLDEGDRTEEHRSAYIADLAGYATGLAAAGRARPNDQEFFRDQAISAYEQIVFAAGDGTLPALEAYVALGDLYADAGDFETASAYYQSVAAMLLKAGEAQPNERQKRRGDYYDAQDEGGDGWR